MARVRRFLRHAAVPLGVSFLAPAAGAQGGLPSDSAIASILESRVRDGHHAGLVVGIVEDGRRRVIVAGAAGPDRPPLSGTTLFEKPRR